MSRSYRKNFITEQSQARNNTPKFFKRVANRKLRRIDDLPECNAYKRYYDSWNICDYKSLIDEESWWMKSKPWQILSK